MDIMKPIAWPNNSRASVMITFNLVAEDFWLDMDASNVNRPKTLSMGQYGPRRGLKRILDVLNNFEVKATFFVPGRIAEKYPDQVLNIIEQGHEVGHLGYKHENYALLTRDQQIETIIKGSKTLEKICGVSPVGFRAPVGDITLDTMPILEELGFKYSSTMHGDDRPTMSEIKGKHSELVELHTHWELNDFHYFAFNYYPPFPAGNPRIANYTHVLSIWKDEFDAYFKYGLNYVITLHPQIIGTPGRVSLLENLLYYMQSKGAVWFSTGKEVADFWQNYSKNKD